MVDYPRCGSGHKCLFQKADKEKEGEMIDNTLKVVVAMICITALEMVAMVQGFNGLLLTLAIGAVAGLGGYEVKNIKDWLGKRKKNE